MPKTARLELLYPQENQNPWFEIFKDFANGIDLALYASREDRNLVIEGGGLLSWNATSGELSWTSALYITSPYTGYALEIPTSQSPATINDGQFFYVEVTRAAGATVTLTAKVSSVIPSNNNAFLIAVRHGDIIYFRNGRGFDDGDSGLLYNTAVRITGFDRIQISIGTTGDTWIDELGSAPEQSSVSGPALTGNGFTDALFAPESVDVFYGTALCHYTSGAPGSTGEWTWVTSGTPSPVIQIGAGSIAGDIVTIKYPK